MLGLQVSGQVAGESEVLVTDPALEELLFEVDAVHVALEGTLPAEALAAVGALEGSNFVVNNFFVLPQITNSGEGFVA